MVVINNFQCSTMKPLKPFAKALKTPFRYCLFLSFSFFGIELLMQSLAKSEMDALSVHYKIQVKTKRVNTRIKAVLKSDKLVNITFYLNQFLFLQGSKFSILTYRCFKQCFRMNFRCFVVFTNLFILPYINLDQ